MENKIVLFHAEVISLAGMKLGTGWSKVTLWGVTTRNSRSKIMKLLRH